MCQFSSMLFPTIYLRLNLLWWTFRSTETISLPNEPIWPLITHARDVWQVYKIFIVDSDIVCLPSLCNCTVFLMRYTLVCARKCRPLCMIEIRVMFEYYKKIVAVNKGPLKILIYIYIYTGCHRRKGPNFGRVFLMLNYTDITQNTHIQSWTVTEIMAREFWNFDSCYTLTDCQIHIETGRNMWFL